MAAHIFFAIYPINSKHVLHVFLSKKTCLYKILFLTTIETIETTFVTMYLVQGEACCLYCLYCRFNHLSCHANIVQRVKTCYKIKIGFRVLICCFGRVKLRKQHPCLTIAPLLSCNSATIRV